jgi:hypothetical protein
MVLNLTPREYLEMLTVEYREYQHYQDSPLSMMRKAINCCALSDALPEVISAHRNPTDPPTDIKKKADDYRERLRQLCEAHHTVRDFCDASKHVTLSRKSVSLEEAARIKAITKGSPMGLALVFTHAQDVYLLVLRHKDGREEYMDNVLKQVIASWNVILDEDKR